ncbi:GtrA family protein [Halobacteriales archaeon SW_12_69_24]|nr:MAG: GtrA family protein [Halobacteriales archaeon SW_12_69_24]
MVRRHLRMAVEGPLAVRLRRFFIVGLVAAAIQQALLFWFVEPLEINFLVAAAIAIEMTIVFQYVVNNAWTFTAYRKTEWRPYLYGLLKTNVVRGTAIPLQLGLLYVFRAFLLWDVVQFALVEQYGFVSQQFGISGSSQIVLLANLIAIPISGVYRYALDARWTWA